MYSCPWLHYLEDEISCCSARCCCSLSMQAKTCSDCKNILAPGACIIIFPKILPILFKVMASINYWNFMKIGGSVFERLSFYFLGLKGPNFFFLEFSCSSGTNPWCTTIHALVRGTSIRTVLHSIHVYAGVPPFLQSPFLFTTVGHPFCPHLYFFLVALLTSQVPMWLLKVYLLASSFGQCFCLHAVGQLPRMWSGSPQVQHAGSWWSLGVVRWRQPTQNVPTLNCQSPKGIPAAISAVFSLRVWWRSSLKCSLAFQQYLLC